MSRVADFSLSEIPRQGRKPKYPWEEWFDGQTHILEQGEDYQADSPKSFRSTVYSAAERLGVEVITKIIDGELHIQAINPKPKSNGHRPVKRKRRGS